MHPRKFRSWLIALPLIVVLIGSGCQPITVPAAGDADGDAKSLVIDSGRNENLVGPLIEQYEEQSGVQMDVRKSAVASALFCQARRRAVKPVCGCRKLRRAARCLCVLAPLQEKTRRYRNEPSTPSGESTMQSHLAFDHVIIAVRDLDAATANYRALGFAAYYGGQHTHKATHNALISLADGSYLELLAPMNPDHIDPSIDMLAFGEGLNGYALLAQDLHADAARLQRTGLAFSGPNAGHRTRYDGERVAWQTLNFADQPRSPFLISDETPHILRVPDDPDKVRHANGVAGVDAIVIAARDLDAATARYAAILGQEPSAGSGSRDASTVDFALANCTLTLFQPRELTGALAEQLAGRNEIPHTLRLRTTAAARRGQLDPVRSHGARIELIPTSDGS